MEGQMKSLIFGLILILFGVSLVPIVFTAIGSANWNLTSGDTTYNLEWVGYIVGLTFAVALVGIGVAVVVNAFRKH